MTSPLALKRPLRAFVPLCAVPFLLLTWPTGADEPAKKPNIVLLFIDDWAWNGSPIAMDDSMPNSCMPLLQMPNVERLAREGMKFTNAYASPQCSPSRVCVQTGQSSPRNGFTVFMNDRGQDYFDEKGYPGFPVIPCVSDMMIDADAVTIPEALQPFGYVSAHIGKWHMRGNPDDEGYVLHDGDTSNKPGNTLPEGAKQRLPDDLTDPKLMFSVTEKALGFMSQQAKAGKPFYLQLSHYAMHEGRECLPATREKYAQHPLVQAYYRKIGKTAEKVKRKEDPAMWLGMGDDLDGRIGAVLDRIQELGIEDNTFVVLVSDNGYRHKELQLTEGLKQPHHATKWWVWQGGIRVPMIVKGPGIKAGSVFEGNVVNYDFLPTFVDWAGGDPAQLKDIDGVSLASYMAGEMPTNAFLKRNLYFHYPHYRSSMPHSAVVSGNHKLLHFYERPDLPMLFDLSLDRGEVTNIASQRPAEHKRLFAEMMHYFKEVDARLPKANPGYNPEHYKATKEYEKRIAWGPFEGRRTLDEDEKPRTSAPSTSDTSKRLPNIVIILADDLGYGSLNSYGAQESYIRTPNIDRLAKEGRRFTDANSPSSVCSPTRYGLLTGRYDWRTDAKHGVLNTTDPLHIDTSRSTIASLLKGAGYRTAAIGKWHLGYGKGRADFTQPLTPGPLDIGFDYHFAVPQNHGDASGIYVRNREVVGLRSNRRLSVGKSPYGRDYIGIDAPQRVDENVMDELTKEAVHWLQQQSNDSPFFLYFAPVAIHFPFTPSTETKGTSGCGLYGDWIHELDLSVGRLLDALDQMDVTKDTLVIFTSDNGGVLMTEGDRPEAEAFRAGLRCNGKWRGRKHSIYEGGFRVPFLVRWPGTVPVGTSCDETINLVDLYATVASVIGQDVPADKAVAEDSFNALPAFLGHPVEQVIAVIYDLAQSQRQLCHPCWTMEVHRGRSESDLEARFTKTRTACSALQPATRPGGAEQSS